MTTGTALRQTAVHVGPANLLAISGGRVGYDGPHTLVLPVRYGYRVEVEYVPGSDLYTVRRMFRRGGRDWCKGELVGLYADQVGDAAYRASCFRDPFGGQ